MNVVYKFKIMDINIQNIKMNDNNGINSINLIDKETQILFDDTINKEKIKINKKL